MRAPADADPGGVPFDTPGNEGRVGARTACRPVSRQKAWRVVLRALPARVLTLSRVLGLPPFLWLLATAVPGERRAAWAVALYVFFALSDFLDGPLARRAGTADPRWGRIDVAADILFNAASLAVAAALGLVGFWVPAGVAALGGRFLVRVSRAPEGEARRVEDPPGKMAGVLYYGLVALVVFEVSTGAAGRWPVARAGDLVFLYTAALLLRSR